MNVLEFLESILAGVCLTIGEILEMHLVEDHTCLDRVGGNLKQVKLIRPAEIIIPQHVFLLSLHQQNSLRLYGLDVDYGCQQVCMSQIGVDQRKEGVRDYNRLSMYNNFKNPFEMDEEDTIIKLDPAQGNQEQQIAFNPYKQDGNAAFIDNPSRVETESSMFNALDETLKQAGQTQLDEHDDPPLLQDIGIDIELIKRRLISIVSLGEADRQLITAPDLSGPILVAFLLGLLLLLGGKIHFSDILTYFILGNGAMYLLFNCMTKDAEVTFYSVMSYLGYSLLPMLPLAVLGIFIALNSSFGVLASLILAAWSSYTAGGMISLILNRVQGRILIIYPLFLFYLSFALIIIF